MDESFVFYGTFYEQIAELDDETQLVFFRAITEYGLFGTEPVFTGLKKAAWIPIKNAIDRAQERRIERSENGKKGGAPKGSRNNPAGRSAENGSCPQSAEQTEQKELTTANQAEPELTTANQNKAELTITNQTKPELTTSNLNGNGNGNVNVDVVASELDSLDNITGRAVENAVDKSSPPEAAAATAATAAATAAAAATATVATATTATVATATTATAPPLIQKQIAEYGFDYDSDTLSCFSTRIDSVANGDTAYLRYVYDRLMKRKEFANGNVETRRRLFRHAVLYWDDFLPKFAAFKAKDTAVHIRASPPEVCSICGKPLETFRGAPSCTPCNVFYDFDAEQAKWLPVTLPDPNAFAELRKLMSSA